MKVELKDNKVYIDDKVEIEHIDYPQKIAIYFEEDPVRKYFGDNTSRWDNAVCFELIGRK